MADPWVLTTPPGTLPCTIHRDDDVDLPLLVCRVGGATLTYLARAIEDLHANLPERGDWVPRGGSRTRPAQGRR